MDTKTKFYSLDEAMTVFNEKCTLNAEKQGFTLVNPQKAKEFVFDRRLNPKHYEAFVILARSIEEHITRNVALLN